MVVPTLNFKVLYVLVIISHARRKIECFAITEHPTAEWLIQQIRNATPFGKQPKYLIHDNSGEFRSLLFRQYLAKINIVSKNITPHSPWQNGICERLIGTLRRELLNYAVPLNQRHLERLLEEYVDFYNTIRPHKTLGGKPPVVCDIKLPLTKAADVRLKATPILGGLYHSHQRVA